MGNVSSPYSVCLTDGTSTETQDSVWTCRDQPTPQRHSEQRSTDTQDSELSLTLHCYTEPNPTDTQESVCESDKELQDGSALSLHCSTESLGSVCNGGEQQILKTPLKMCSVRLVDCMINIKQEITAQAEGNDYLEGDDDDENDNNINDFIPSGLFFPFNVVFIFSYINPIDINEEITNEGEQNDDDRSDDDDFLPSGMFLP